MHPSPRYPRYACRACTERACDADGALLAFSNASMSGGYMARYVATGVEYPSHEVYIDGVKCRADEGYMGGIVVQPAD